MTTNKSRSALGRWEYSRLHETVREGRQLLRLAFPIMLIALVNMGMSVTDTTMVSIMYGTKALASVAVASDLYSIIFYLGAGIIAGVAPSYAAAVARGDLHDQFKLKQVGWCIVLAVSAVAVPALWSSTWWLPALGLERDMLHESEGYTRSIALALFPMFGVSLYRTLLTSEQKPHSFLKITLAMLPLNAAGNYVLMAGVGPVPAFGPAGAGMSTLLIAAATLMALVALEWNSRRGRLQVIFRPTRGDVWAVIKVGLPIGVTTIGEVGIFLAATVYSGRLGASEVAAHALVLRTAGVLYAIPVAILQASLVRMARLAEKDKVGQRLVKRTSYLIAFSCGIILCSALVVGADAVALLFFQGASDGAEAARLAIGLLCLLGLMELFTNPGSAATGLLRGRKDVRVPMFMNIGGQWLIGAPVGIYLCEAMKLGVTGVWLGLLIGTISTCCMTLYRTRRI